MLLEESHCAAVCEVSFAPPGAFGVNGSGSGPQVVVSASADGSLRGWTLAGPEARPRRTMEAMCKNVGGAQCVAFTADAVLTGRVTSPLNMDISYRALNPLLCLQQLQHSSLALLADDTEAAENLNSKHSV